MGAGLGTKLITTHPPLLVGALHGPNMLPITWGVVTLHAHLSRDQSGPTHTAVNRPRRHFSPIMWITEAPPTLSHAYVVARMKHGSYPLSPNTRPQYGNTGEHCSKPSTHSTKREGMQWARNKLLSSTKLHIPAHCGM